MGQNLIIGVDFDNTIISYDDIIHEAAIELKLIPPHIKKNKRLVRDEIRKLENGDFHWQKIQAIAYAQRIHEAKPMEGVLDFFHRCQALKAQVFIVSHKTVFADRDETRTDLREVARAWLEAQSFFEKPLSPLRPEAVFFEPTKESKVHRIARLGCTHFIDDLFEIFQEKYFPKQTRKILYSPELPSDSLPGIDALASWPEISAHVFE